MATPSRTVSFAAPSSVRTNSTRSDTHALPEAGAAVITHQGGHVVSESQDALRGLVSQLEKTISELQRGASPVRRTKDKMTTSETQSQSGSASESTVKKTVRRRSVSRDVHDASRRERRRARESSSIRAAQSRRTRKSLMAGVDRSGRTRRCEVYRTSMAQT